MAAGSGLTGIDSSDSDDLGDGVDGGENDPSPFVAG